MNWKEIYAKAKTPKHRKGFEAARKYLALKTDNKIIDSYLQITDILYCDLQGKNIFWDGDEWKKHKHQRDIVKPLDGRKIDTLLYMGRLDVHVSSNVSLRSGTAIYRDAQYLAKLGLLNYIHNSYWSVTQAGWVFIHTLEAEREKARKTLEEAREAWGKYYGVEDTA